MYCPANISKSAITKNLNESQPLIYKVNSFMNAYLFSNRIITEYNTQMFYKYPRKDKNDVSLARLKTISILTLLQLISSIGLFLKFYRVIQL